MASVTRSFAFLTLLISLFTSSSSSLVSLKTLHLYLAVFAFRLLSLFRHEGYLPYDKTGDWFYHFVEVRGGEERSDDLILHPAITNNPLLVTSLLAPRR